MSLSQVGIPPLVPHQGGVIPESAPQQGEQGISQPFLHQEQGVVNQSCTPFALLPIQMTPALFSKIPPPPCRRTETVKTHPSSNVLCMREVAKGTPTSHQTDNKNHGTTKPHVWFFILQMSHCGLFCVWQRMAVCAGIFVSVYDSYAKSKG